MDQDVMRDSDGVKNTGWDSPGDVLDFRKKREDLQVTGGVWGLSKGFSGITVGAAASIFDFQKIDPETTEG